MVDMGHNAKLTSGIWIDLSQCTNFVCGTQISWKIFTSIQSKTSLTIAVWWPW